ncbi:hypothetical protein PRIPAC_97470 [Pristionchus pacificus]|uniref:ShK domain-containing protein n=1 Tax=Pristionchus pacificus TaxID=54126 RepID=A0A2A6B383_PRIPA|nr:hypothetical protein PRIPAC_97470 [Pristionchus pacificus]|eukprot:PDM60334.1 ShK domain-containing protein [Pristionchus pacificus]
MQFFLPTVVFLALVSGTAAQCTGNDHPNCRDWKNNGYCTNTAQTMDTRKKYCGVSCGFCNTDGTQTSAGGGANLTACADANANCDKWAKNTTNAFCANQNITKDQKTLFCAKTCAFEINPTADCAMYTATGTDFARGTPSNKTATPGTAVKSGVKTGTTLNRVFAKSGCTVKLFAVEAPTDTSTGEAAMFVGNTTTNFFPVAEANNEGLSFLRVLMTEADWREDPPILPTITTYYLTPILGFLGPIWLKI